MILVNFIKKMINATSTPINDSIIISNFSKKETFIGICLGAGLTLALSYVYKRLSQKQKTKQLPKNKSLHLIDLIGKTPMIYLQRLSEALNCQIYAKVQYLNPFGSSKDRAVKYMLDKILEKQRKIGHNITEIVQASSGSTAISLVQICKIYGLKTTLFLPDDLAEDKYNYLQILGANVVKVPQVSIVDPNHFFNKARDYALSHNACFLNQFDNLDNLQVHQTQTGPQIMEQMHNKVDAFVCSAGTGGTLAGVSKYLKKATNNDVKIILADPEGSGLHAKVKYGTLFTIQQKQGYRLKNPFDTIIQGVGLNRPTKNFDNALIDDSFKIKDIQALHMANYLIQNEGLFVGGSCALNLAAVVKYCRKNPGKRVVTILHDSGNRYLRKFYNSQYLKQKKIIFTKRDSYPPGNLDFID